VTRSAAFDKFVRSMIIDYSTWHDGEGYDLEALRAIEKMLIERNNEDWRDVEALGALGTPTANAMVRKALTVHNHQTRLEAAKWLKDERGGDVQREAVICEAIRTGELYGGLSQAIDQAMWHPTPATTDALFHAALERSGENAASAAAALLNIFKVTDDPLAWSERPLILRFVDAGGGAPREAAFCELCAKCGVDPAKYRQK